MQYRSLGRTGLQVSPLCLGTMMFGLRTEAREAYQIVDRALDCGINFVDTANIYSYGRSEELLGEALRRNGKRQRVVLATKVYGHIDPSDPNARGCSRRHIIEQCEASLRRLQTDWIDLYQIHRPCPEVPIDETLRALDGLVRAGKVRAIGTSTFAAWQIVQSLWVSERLGLDRFVCEQPPYSILERRIERELIPMAQTYGFGIIPWSPLAGGLLSGKYRRDLPAPEGSRYADLDAIPDRRQHWTEPALIAIEQLQGLATTHGCSLSQLALAWCQDCPGITSPIVGPRTIEQLEDNLGALDLTLTSDELAEIDRIVPPGTHVSSFYEADWGPQRFLP
jgi:aryl-alcohol dehydrogenase-like predicted oxidoreductase